MREMKVTEDEIRTAIKSSNSMASAASKLPINFKTFKTYAKRLNIYVTNAPGKGSNKNRPFISLDEILTGKHPEYKTFRLKNRLIKEKGWEWKCHSCFNDKWLTYYPIPLELDHIDGNPYNHKEENLRLLCPNCHALTPTYRNKKR